MSFLKKKVLGAVARIKEEKDADKSTKHKRLTHREEIAALKNEIEQMRAHHEDEIKRLVQTHQEELAALKHEMEGLQKVEKDTGGDQQQALTIRNNKIMYLERMLSLAEEDKKKQEIIIMKMTYNEELRKKACSVLEQKNVKLESSTNYLKSVCVERDENISNMQGEIDIKNVEMRRLHDEIDVTTYDLKQLREKNSALHKRVSELQYQIEEYEKKKEESKLVTQLPNAGITPTETRETTPPTRAAPNRRTNRAQRGEGLAVREMRRFLIDAKKRETSSK